jgi:hypothetical protein
MPRIFDLLSVFSVGRAYRLHLVDHRGNRNRNTLLRRWSLERPGYIAELARGTSRRCLGGYFWY